MKKSSPLLVVILSLIFMRVAVSGAEPEAPDFATKIVPIFTKYCTGCHNAKDHEGKLSLESFADLQKGGENGSILLPGQADSSRIIRLLTGQDEPSMPPEGEKAPTADEIALLKVWISTGAKGPAGAELDRKILLTPKIAAAADAAKQISTLAYSPDGKLVAIGRYGAIEIQKTADGAKVHTLGGIPGKVNALHFSHDGKLLVSAAGVSGVYGMATIWNVEQGARIRDIEGHRDTLYDAELSPDGTLLATCSYDRMVTLWKADTGEKVRVLDGHNDAVYDVAFSNDSAVLASASGDKTVKLWKVATGERLDTLGQPQGEQYVVLFSPDGQYVLAGGVDSRIRVWKFVSQGKPQTNPLVYARFAHEGAIVALAFSGDGKWLLSAAEDRTVKRWETGSYTQQEQFEKQPDQIAELASIPDEPRFTVARTDGSVVQYPLSDKMAASASESPMASVAVAAVDSSTMNEVQENEPNDAAHEPMAVVAPVRLRGAIDVVRDQQKSDSDLFRFAAKRGQEWMIEVKAAREKSPLDSKVEVLDANGQPVPRVLLQAVRDSYFTFRGKDFDTSDDFRVFNWEEMEINELLYANGEVVKLWHYPRGPDSGYIVYPGRGRRWTYFDTTPIAHALGQPCFIVEPHLPGSTLIPNGLPVFTLYYENDDDSFRQWGSDSRLLFIAPADGEYLVRLTDARGMESEKHTYDLLIRPRKQDFNVKIDNWAKEVSAGGGKEFTIGLERLDEFEGEVRIDIEGLPAGFSASTPIIVQPGQTQSLGVLNALPDAPMPTPEQGKAAKVIASAEVNGQTIKKEIANLGELKLAGKPKVIVRMVPANAPAEGEVPGAVPWQKPLELIIAPGQTITAKVKVERNGFDERIPLGGFDSGRNLPHGIFVDNVGLNGLMIIEGQTERVFFITAAKWVPEQTRLFHLQSQVDGNQASWPVLLRVQRNNAVAEK